jgi:hypothetical protein
MRPVTHATPLPVPMMNELRKRKFIMASRDRLKSKLLELGFEWCPQLQLFVHYDGPHYTIAKAIAIVGKGDKARAFRLR